MGGRGICEFSAEPLHQLKRFASEVGPQSCTLELCAHKGRITGMCVGRGVETTVCCGQQCAKQTQAAWPNPCLLNPKPHIGQ